MDLMGLITDPNKTPKIPDTLSKECKDFINQCLTKEYERRPSAEQLKQHVWMTL